MTQETDRIQTTILLRAPLERVWRAISEAKQFGNWLGMTSDEEFAPKTVCTVTVTGTKIDPEFAKLQQPYLGMKVEFHIDRMEPMHLFSLRWHPNAQRGVDYTGQPMTLAQFELKEAPGGTAVTITESGFDRVPAARRLPAYQAHVGAWAQAGKLLDTYVSNVV